MPSARKDETNSPSTVTSTSMMRDGPAFVITTSLRTSDVTSGAALPVHDRAQQAALLVLVAPVEHALEGGVELGERDLGEEAQAAEVHAEDRDGLRRAAGSPRAACRRRPAPRARRRGPAMSRPEATRHDALEPGPPARPAVRLVEADRARRARGATSTRSRTTGPASWRSGRARMPIVFMAPPPWSRHGLELVRRRGPLRPGRGAGRTRGCPRRRGPAKGRRRARRSPARCASAGHVAQRLRGAAPGPSRCRRGPPGSGPPRTAASPARPRPRPGPSTETSAGRILRTEMNDTSITASEQGSGTTSGESERAFVRSRTTTRGSWRSLSWSWPRPTSTA